jgi:hypothetical protein
MSLRDETWVDFSFRLQKVNVRALWRGQPPPKWKKSNNSLQAVDVEISTTLGTFACTDRKKDDGDEPRLDPLRTSSFKEGVAGAIGE